MLTKLLKITGTWREIADAARTTVGKDTGTGEPSSVWKKKILLAEHSPIRLLSIRWKWYRLAWWVQTHFTRHKFGVEWFVSTSRTDITGVDRKTLGQDAPIDVEGIANAQAIINISRKRLCKQAASETRETWQMFLSTFKPYEPELHSVCVPECIYRGFCPEMKPCGYSKTTEYQKKLVAYREVNND